VSSEELDALAEAVTERVVERLRAEPAPPPSQPAALVDAATLARALGVGVSYVYSRSAELGARRLGSGPKARLRFDLERALEAHASGAPGCTAPATPRAAKRRPRRAASSGALLPIRGRAARATPTANAEETHDAA
jgi:hypothetical protein